jgi:hypothetical protein
MLFSSPHSLLALVICLLETRALADPSPTPSPTAHFGNVGDYVASGLGINNGSTTQTTQTAAPALPTTGTGQEYASQCADALSTWSSSSFAWQWDNVIPQTTTFSSGFTETFEGSGSTKVTSMITLCDGYPRVVGHTSVSRGKNYTTTVAWTNTITESEANHAYPTPAPCSIRPSDCETLSQSYNSWLTKELSEKGFATVPAPMCTIEPSFSPSYSENTRGQTCDNCMIAAATARVMFWPVTTRAGSDLCNVTASTITASPTGPPNSFITDGITITSPTVAVSLGFMSRVDGCGTTIDHTIIPVHPDQVSSVRGFRALFSHHRFNFADLNYWCMNTNTTNATIADGLGDSCYQQVPADAYFGGLNNAVVLDQAPFRNLSKAQMTIWDDYQPQLLPPQTMTEAITSLWGNDCIIHPDGVWDPPIALTPEAVLAVPTFPGGGASTESSDAESTPASPINSYGAVPPRQTGINVPTSPSAGESTSVRQHFTALPEVTSGPSSGTYGGQGSGSGSDGAGSGKSGNGGSGNDVSGNGGVGNEGSGNGGSGSGESGSGGSGSGGSGSVGSGSDESGSDGSGSDGSSSGQNDDSDSNGATGSSPDGSDAANGSNNQNDQSSHSNSGSSQGSQDGSGSGNNQGSHDNSGSSNSPGQSGADQANSGGGGVTRINVHTTIITVGSTLLQCTQDSNGAWIVPDVFTTRTASIGGSAVEINGITLTAGANGLVNVNAQNTVITIGNKAITATQDANGAWIIPDSSTTHTASMGGSAVNIDGTTYTAGTGGLINVNARNTVIAIGNKVIMATKDANGAWIIRDSSTTHTASVGGSAINIDGTTFTAGAGGLINVDAQNTALTVGNKAITASQDANGAWIIPDSYTTHTVSQGGSAVEVDGMMFTAASQGLVKVHPSGTGESSDDIAEASGTGTQRSGASRSSGARLTGATGSNGAAASSTSAADGESSAAGAIRWSPALLAFALLSMYVCAL